MVKRDRTYSNNGTHRLLTWSQRRCLRCQRYLGKHQKKFCTRCQPIEDRKLVAKILREKKDTPAYVATKEAWNKKHPHYGRDKSRKHPKDSDYREEYKLRANVRYNPERYEVGQIV